MNFFRDLLTRATRRLIIADMYDEQQGTMAPVEIAPPDALPQQPQQPQQPAPGYAQDTQRRQELSRLKGRNQGRGFSQDTGYMGYSKMEYDRILPAMVDGLRPFFVPGQMSGIDLLDKYEVDPDFQASFPAEWIEDEKWFPLLAEAIKQLEEEASGQQTAPVVVEPGNMEQLREPEPVAVMTTEQMAAFFETHDPSDPLPDDIAQVPENLATYLDMAKQREVGFIADLSAREEQMKQDEMSQLRGIPPTELASSVFRNMIQDRPDRMEMLSGDNRFSDQIDAWPLDLSEYVFKGVDGGVGPQGEKDFRIRFFLEGGSEFAPPEVQQWMSEENSRANPEVWDNYKELYDLYIDELSEQILSIADPNMPMFDEMGEEDTDMKVRAEEALWNFIVRKLRSKTMRQRKTQLQESDQPGGEEGDGGGLAEQIAAKPQKADAARMSEQDRQEYMSALFGDFSSMATQIHSLAKDARDYLLDKFGREEFIQNKSGKDVSNTPFYAAMFIDAVGDLGSQAMMGWKELADSGQLTPQELDKLSKGQQVTRSPKRVPKDATPEQMEDINRRRQLGNLKYNPESETNWAGVNWYGLVPPGLALGRAMDIWDGKVEPDPDDPNSYKNILPTLENWRGRPKGDLERGNKAHGALFGTAAQFVATELSDFLIDDAFQKYPKNVILAFLNATKAFSGVTDFARYAVYGGEVGANARQELLTDSLDHGLLEQEEVAMLSSYLEQQGVKPVGVPVDSSFVEFIPDEVAYEALKRRIGSIKKDHFKQVPMTMWNSVANIMSLPEEHTMGTPPNAEQRAEWNTRRLKDFGVQERRRRRAEAIFYVIKTAMDRLEVLQGLKTSMSKFASTDIVDAEISAVQQEAKAIIQEIRRMA